MTKQRRIILETIRENDTHMTPEEIFIKTREKLPSIAVATVYNNLKTLTGEEKIRKIQVPGQPDHYDRNMEPHEHIICEKCGKMMDARPDEFISAMEKTLGIRITGYHLTLYYVCAECKKSV